MDERSRSFLAGGLILAGLVLGLARAHAATIAAKDAAHHVGQNVTVCGEVVSVHETRRSHVTFLDFGHEYPLETFTGVIFRRERAHFGTLDTLLGRRVCVTGTVQLYHGKPEMILDRPKELRLP